MGWLKAAVLVAIVGFCSAQLNTRFKSPHSTPSYHTPVQPAASSATKLPHTSVPVSEAFEEPIRATVSDDGADRQPEENRKPASPDTEQDSASADAVSSAPDAADEASIDTKPPKVQTAVDAAKPHDLEGMAASILRLEKQVNQLKQEQHEYLKSSFEFSGWMVAPVVLLVAGLTSEEFRTKFNVMTQLLGVQLWFYTVHAARLGRNMSSKGARE